MWTQRNNTAMRRSRSTPRARGCSRWNVRAATHCSVTSARTTCSMAPRRPRIGKMLRCIRSASTERARQPARTRCAPCRPTTRSCVRRGCMARKAPTSSSPRCGGSRYRFRRRVVTSVLVVANGPMQRQMAGPSIRGLCLSRVLHARGHQVTVALPAPTDLPDQGFPLVVYTADSIVSLAGRADVVLVQGYVLRRHPDLAHVHSRIVVDLYDPFPLENLLVFQRAPMERREAEHLESITAIWEQLARGDFFLCSSERQRDFWVGGLTAMNRVNPYTYSEDPTLRNLIDVVPFGIPSVPASSTQRAIRSRVAGVGRDDIVLLWGGGVYNWFDPAILIRAVGRLADRHPRLRLVFMGGAHPEPGINELMWAVPEARRLADELDLTGRFVFFNDTWVPYEARADWLLDADVGVSTHFDHVETRFSFRTRVLDYFWAGLPVICTAGDTIADTVASRELGATVPPEDLDAVVAAIDHMAADRRWRNACSRRVRDV